MAVTNHYQFRDWRWIMLSLLNEERQLPAFARCIGRRIFSRIPDSPPSADRHARSLELIEFLRRFLPQKTSPILAQDPRRKAWLVRRDRHPRRICQRPADAQNDVLCRSKNDTMLTSHSPIWIDGSQKTAPRHPPGSASQQLDCSRCRLLRRRDPALRSSGRGGVTAPAAATCSLFFCVKPRTSSKRGPCLAL